MGFTWLSQNILGVFKNSKRVTTHQEGEQVESGDFKAIKSSKRKGSSSGKSPESRSPSPRRHKKMGKNGMDAWHHGGIVELRDLERTKATSGDEQNFCVVEVFTTEGSSSCPTGDLIVKKLRHLPENCLLIQYHVDSWNESGWHDPFSSSEYTQKQKSYLAVEAITSIYSPQVIVHGSIPHELFAFQGEEICKKVKKVHSKKSKNDKMEVKMNITEFEGTTMHLSATLDVTMRNFSAAKERQLEVIAALTEDDIVSKVKAGENKGRTLTHFAVARATAQAPIQIPFSRVSARIGARKVDGHFENQLFNARLKFNANLVDSEHPFQLNKMRIVVYVQEILSKRILGACALKIGINKSKAAEDLKSFQSRGLDSAPATV